MSDTTSGLPRHPPTTIELELYPVIPPLDLKEVHMLDPTLTQFSPLLDLDLVCLSSSHLHTYVHTYIHAHTLSPYLSISILSISLFSHLIQHLTTHTSITHLFTSFFSFFFFVTLALRLSASSLVISLSFIDSLVFVFISNNGAND